MHSAYEGPCQPQGAQPYPQNPLICLMPGSLQEIPTCKNVHPAQNKTTPKPGAQGSTLPRVVSREEEYNVAPRLHYSLAV